MVYFSCQNLGHIEGMALQGASDMGQSTPHCGEEYKLKLMLTSGPEEILNEDQLRRVIQDNGLTAKSCVSGLIHGDASYPFKQQKQQTPQRQSSCLQPFPWCVHGKLFRLATTFYYQKILYSEMSKCCV